MKFAFAFDPAPWSRPQLDFAFLALRDRHLKVRSEDATQAVRRTDDYAPASRTCSGVLQSVFASAHAGSLHAVTRLSAVDKSAAAIAGDARDPSWGDVA